MPRKHDKKGKKRVVLSLAEFNEDAGLGGANPELASLPSAPKAPEEWEAEGGRPEYNSRGYKERNQNGRDRRPRDGDDYEDHDWSRRGPLDASDSSFGAPAGERDWGGMRGEGVATDGAQPERDWGGMRRGPVDAAFEGRGSGGGVGAGGEERNWSLRKGPVEAEVQSGMRGAVADEAWGSARGQVVESAFQRADDAVNWGAERKGPVESDFGNGGESGGGTAADGSQPPRDWGVRKGPVEAAVPSRDQDWGGARGRSVPIEAEVSTRQQAPAAADWTEMRRAPVEQEVLPEADGSRADGDWSARRGPLDGKRVSATRATREVDFTDMRKGAKLREIEAEGSAEVKGERAASVGSGSGGAGSGSGAAASERTSWRRDGGGVPAMRGNMQGGGGGGGTGGGRAGFGRPISTGSDGSSRERGNWRSGRRAPADDAAGTSAAPAGDAETVATDVAGDGGGAADEGENDDNWTTVRANPKRSSAQARRVGYAAGGSGGAREFSRDARDGGREGNGRWRGGGVSGRSGSAPSQGGGFGRGSGAPRPVRPGFGTDGVASATKTDTSPVTSATSET